jgi:hypothetical protein
MFYVENRLRIACHLPELEKTPVLIEALESARRIDLADRHVSQMFTTFVGHVKRDVGGRSKALAALACYLPQLPRATLLSLWQETLHVLAARTRPNLLADIRALIPVILALGGEEAISGVFCAIQDVGRWWP